MHAKKADMEFVFMSHLSFQVPKKMKSNLNSAQEIFDQSYVLY